MEIFLVRMVFFDLSTCLRDATLHDNSPTLQYRHLCNAADTWLWRPFIVSVLRRVNSPFMINTPLKEGQGKNTHTPPDGRGVGGGRIQSDRPFCNANTDFWCTLWGLTVTQTPVMRTLNSAVLMSVLRFNSHCWSNFNESVLQSPLQPFLSRHAMLLPNKLRSVAWWDKTVARETNCFAKRPKNTTACVL